MFGFGRKPDPQSPSAAIRQAIGQAGPVGRIDDLSTLRVVESRGRYAGRTVTFVRIYDPALAAQSVVTVKHFDDLDLHPGLVLWSGHVERDGGVSIRRNGPALDAATPTRASANRDGHEDDERFVFFTRDAAAPGEV
jgi:hypothetical protein